MYIIEVVVVLTQATVSNQCVCSLLAVERRACDACAHAVAHGSHPVAQLTGTHGYIASAMTTETSSRTCGTAHCPYRITVQPGQKIRLVLHDFAFGFVEP